MQLLDMAWVGIFDDFYHVLVRIDGQSMGISVNLKMDTKDPIIRAPIIHRLLYYFCFGEIAINAHHPQVNGGVLQAIGFGRSLRFGNWSSWLHPTTNLMFNFS